MPHDEKAVLLSLVRDVLGEGAARGAPPSGTLDRMVIELRTRPLPAMATSTTCVLQALLHITYTEACAAPPQPPVRALAPCPPTGPTSGCAVTAALWCDETLGADA